MMKEKEYMNHFDYKMTYHHDAQIQITFACPWAGVSDLLAPVPPKTNEKLVAAFISNCDRGGANKRYAYLEELMKHIHVHSFGHCLKNADYKYSASSHGNKMRDKINTISEFKFLLAFENNAVEDYVTEKLINAYQAGTVPIYMGSPNIEKWQVAPNSLIKLDDYPDPKDLATYLKFLNDNEAEYMKYFEWKKKGISPTFQRLWDNCFAFAECRLCKYIAKSRTKIGDYEKPEHVPEKGFKGYALQLNGLDADYNKGDDYVEVPHNHKLNVQEEYTLMAWIKLGLITDGRIIDKNKAGEIGGYNLDVVPIDSRSANRGYLRLCVGDGCYQSKRALGIGLWYHIAVTVTTSGANHNVKFFINAKQDSEHMTNELTKTNSWPVRFGRAAEGGGSWRPHHASSVFDGALDEISIWERALSEKEIFDYMYLRPSGDVEDLVGWWNFNEGSGEVVHDVGPNELHGKIYGEPTWIVSVSKPVLDPSFADISH